MTVEERAAQIELLLMDCDGVLTDGGLYYSRTDIPEMKRFHVQDGTAIQLAQAQGLRVGIISGRESIALTERAKELGLSYCFQNVEDKAEAVSRIYDECHIDTRRVAYVGDDLPDLRAFACVGLPIAVANAVDEVKFYARYITKARGGQGAVREVVELLLKAQGKWQDALRPFISFPL